MIAYSVFIKKTSKEKKWEPVSYVKLLMLIKIFIGIEPTLL